MLVVHLQTKELPAMCGVRDAHVLLNLGDTVTTDHISPCGNIAATSPAAKYLISKQYVCVNTFTPFTGHYYYYNRFKT